MRSNGHTPPDMDHLLELPPTLESINAKLNHLITRLEYSIRVGHGAREAVDLAMKSTVAEAVRIATESKEAAQKAANAATELNQSRQPLSRRERLLMFCGGAALGGVAAAIALSVMMALSFTTQAVAAPPQPAPISTAR